MSRINLPTLLAAFIGGLVALHDAQSLAASLAGLTLLAALVAYDERGVRNGLQSLVFALVCGLALLCTVSYPLRALLGDSGLAVLPVFLAKEFSAAIWIAAAAIFWFVDRARMNARQSLSLRPQAMPPFEPQPIREPRTFSPVARPEVQFEPRAVPEPEPVYAPTAQAAMPATPVPASSGKEVSIYVNMMGEGMSVLRAVRAEHLGRDFYIIVDEMPADETWEYATGQVVRCRKKNLSNGKGLVAYEEAPRAQ
jgi:hypothetical protein